ncbi:MAG: hypothetical protein Q8M65_11300 [Rhodoglobus sp.]|nr:hypothetical protein [Rhodoglobus sp.]
MAATVAAALGVGGGVAFVAALGFDPAPGRRSATRIGRGRGLRFGRTAARHQLHVPGAARLGAEHWRTRQAEPGEQQHQPDQRLQAADQRMGEEEHDEAGSDRVRGRRWVRVSGGRR